MRPFPAVMLQGGIGPACIWNAASEQGAASILPATGNLEAQLCTAGGPFPGAILGTVGKNAGKRYIELFLGLTGIVGAGVGVGLSPQPNMVSPYRFGGSGYGIQYNSDGSLVDADTFGTISGYGPTFNSNDIVQIAVDLSANLAWFGKNGTFVGNPGAGTGGVSILHTTYYPAAYANLLGFQHVTANFGPTAGFAFVPPTGFGQWR